MAQASFNLKIVDEALGNIREAEINPGWHIMPSRFAISDQAGELSPERTTASMLPTWFSSPFSGVYPNGARQIVNSIVIPPTAYPINKNIGEIYFIYKNQLGVEFLFAVAQPTNLLTFVPGVMQNYLFAFTINNVDVTTTFTIDYTFPQDIEDHNMSPTAHSNIISGMITTGVIQWYANGAVPSGYLICDGSEISRATYARLFAIIGTTFGAGDGSKTFNLPNLINRFAEGSLSPGTYLEAGLPDHSHKHSASIWHGRDGGYHGATWGGGDRSDGSVTATFSNASETNPIYGKSTTVQPPALTLLPIIKY